MSDIKKMKKNLPIAEFAAKYTSSSSGVEILLDYFCFAIECRQKSVVPKESPGYKNVVNLLQEIIPRLDNDIFSKCGHWGSEHLTSFRTLRSGIEFLSEDVIENENSLKESWEEFIKSEGMVELNEQLEMMAGSRAEYDNGKHPVDLRYVPQDHNWWSALERNDSRAKFGLMDPDPGKPPWPKSSKSDDDESTKKWEDVAIKTLQERFCNDCFDWRIYKDEGFNELKETIAMHLFSIKEDAFFPALKEDNIIEVFSQDQLDIVRDVQQKIEQIGGTEEIEVQIVPCLLKTKDDKTLSRDVSVFRVKNKDKTTHKLVDGHAKVYNDWKHFLEENILPEGIIAYPKDQFVRVYPKNRQVSIEFCGTRACSSEAGSAVWIPPLASLATIVLFWSPVDWISIGLGAATKFIKNYSEQRTELETNNTHDVALKSVNIFALIGTIEKIVEQKEWELYADTVKSSHRELTILEYWIIKAFLSGMDHKKVIEFIARLYAVCTKNNITNFDIINFVVECRESCYLAVSPIKATQMMNQIRGELADQAYQNLCREEVKGNRLTQEFLELRRKKTPAVEQITAMQMELELCSENIERHREKFQAFKSEKLENAYVKKWELLVIQSDIDKLEKELKEKGDESGEVTSKIDECKIKLSKCEQEITAYQEIFHEDVKSKMEDENAKKLYQQFIDSEQNSEKVNRRTIQATMEMDPVAVFTTAAQANATIRFKNDSSLDFSIKDDISIHPRALAQLYEVSPGNTKPDVEKLFELLKLKKEATPNKDYLLDMENVLKSRRMISVGEIQSFVESMKAALGETGKSCFDDITYAETYALRMVMKNVAARNKGVVFKAAKVLAKKLELSHSFFRLAECVEIIKLVAANTVDYHHSTLSDVYSEEFYKNFLEKGKVAATPKKLLKESVFELLSEDNASSEKLATFVKKRHEEVKAYCDSPDIETQSEHPLSLVYHIKKHGNDVKIYNPLANISSQAEIDEQYCKIIPADFIPGRSEQSNLSTSTVSQDGMSIGRVWRNDDGYLAATRVPYHFALDSKSQRYLRDPLAPWYIQMRESHVIISIEPEKLESHYATRQTK